METFGEPPSLTELRLRFSTQSRAERFDGHAYNYVDMPIQRNILVGDDLWAVALSGEAGRVRSNPLMERLLRNDSLQIEVKEGVQRVTRSFALTGVRPECRSRCGSRDVHRHVNATDGRADAAIHGVVDLREKIRTGNPPKTKAGQLPGGSAS